MLHSNKLQNKMAPEGATDWLMVFKSSSISSAPFNYPDCPSSAQTHVGFQWVESCWIGSLSAAQILVWIICWYVFKYIRKYIYICIIICNIIAVISCHIFSGVVGQIPLLHWNRHISATHLWLYIGFSEIGNQATTLFIPITVKSKAYW